MYGSNFYVTNTEIECTDLYCVKMEQKHGDLICEIHYWAFGHWPELVSQETLSYRNLYILHFMIVNLFYRNYSRSLIQS